MRLSLIKSAVFAAAVVACGFATSAANAQLGTYDFTSKPGNQTSEPVVSNPAGATFSDLVRGSGITASAAVNSFSATGFTTNTTIDLTDYFGFTITPSAGQSLNLTSLAFSERRSGTGITTIGVRTSLDGFGANIATFTVPDDTLSRRQTVNFTGAFTGLTSAVTIRIYGYGAEAAGGTWRLGIASGADNPNNVPANLVVNGTITPTTVTVPEANTFALIAPVLGVLGVVVARRRKLA